MKTWCLCVAAAVAGCLALSSPAFSQRIAGLGPSTAAPEFPQDAAQWINTAPLSIDDLKGKTVVLWFFSEQCPRCRAKWPSLMDLAKLYEGQPVLFIAVNSGASRDAIEKYVHETKVTWPILIDTNRAYELQSGVTPIISLQNICQLKVITPDGQLQRGDWSNVPKSISFFRRGAKWKVEPNEVPLKLVGAWEGVEFGNYRAAGPLLKDALKSTDPETKQAAEKLLAAVQPAIDSQLRRAQDAESKGKAWDAYTLYAGLSQKFLDFDLPASAMESKRKLAEDPKIKAGLSAQRELDRARKLLNSTNPVVHQRAAPILQKIVKDSPDSSAGKEAQRLLSGGH